MSGTDLLVLRPEGLYCPPGDFFIDPSRPVARAVITHAHADHARRGHGAYLAAARGAGLLRQRLGAIPLQGLAYGEPLAIGGVRVSLHPAGHVLGSAQVRLEHHGQVWVASGDYYVGSRGDRDPGCEPFEPQRCDVFVTENTFGLPIYRWPPQSQVLGEIGRWWAANAAAGRASVLAAYSLGKAQRLLAGLDPATGPLVVHESVEPANAAYREAGVALPPTRRLGEVPAGELRRALVILPPMARGWPLPPEHTREAFASGWMQTRARRREQPGRRGFVLSDHADWPGLQQAILATGAERVLVTHGDADALIHWLRGRGLQAGRLVAVGSVDAAGHDG